MNRPPSSSSCVVARRRVADAHAADRVVAEDLLDHGAVADADLGVREGGLAIGGLRRQRVAAVQDDHLADGVGQRERLLQGRVAAAHHADGAVAHQRRVAAGAVADAAPLQALLAVDAERPQPRARGQDHGARRDLAVARRQAPALARGLEAFELGHADLGPVVGGLLLEHRAQLVARDALREPGHAVDALDAEQQPAGRAPAEDQGRAAHARGVHRGGEGADAATGDRYVELVSHWPTRISTPHIAHSCADRTRTPRD